MTSHSGSSSLKSAEASVVLPMSPVPKITRTCVTDSFKCLHARLA